MTKNLLMHHYLVSYFYRNHNVGTGSGSIEINLSEPWAVGDMALVVEYIQDKNSMDEVAITGVFQISPARKI